MRRGKIMSRPNLKFWAKCIYALAIAVLCCICLNRSIQAQQTTAFNYQGKLGDAGSPATGSYDLQFKLWDAAAGGTQQPSGTPVTVSLPGVTVTNGIFTV